MFDVPNSASQRREQKEPQRDPKKSEFLSEQILFSMDFLRAEYCAKLGTNSAIESRKVTAGSNLACSASQSQVWGILRGSAQTERV
jgi:hypothetical protein